MSAVGIDFGNENCYIAVARGGVIETITNDYSQRSTPSYVAFGQTCRDLGTSAKNKYITNLKNTVSDFKRLAGKEFKDPFLQHEISYLPFALHELPNGGLGVEVSYLGKNEVFSIHQITAMMFTKLKAIAETALNTKVTDCVVSVPVFFTDAERRAVLDSCRIAGMHVLRLLNENAAVALAYGFYRQDFSDVKAKKVVFIDVGHSAVQATACSFTHRKLEILANTWDFCLGGRDIDNAMVRHFCQEFKTKYHLDVLNNRRAIIRLLQECEKLKKHLSVNPQILPINIECFMNDKDVSGSLGREKLEELCSDILCRIENVFLRLLCEAKLRPEDICSVELVGGTTRIPAVKALIKKVFGQEPSTTLNLDEAVARGCALQAALLSPALKVKEFSLSDVQPYPIKLVWNIPKSKGEMEVFPKSYQVPFSRLLPFSTNEDFCLEAYYSIGDNTYPDVLIGSFFIKNVNQVPSGESAKVVVKARMNIHGIFTIRSAVIVDKEIKVNNVVLDQKMEDAMDVQLACLSGFETPLNPIVNEEKKSEGGISSFLKRSSKKVVAKEIELQIEHKVFELSESELKELEECEQRMITQDRYENERIDAKNSVEEYMYGLRDQLGESLGNFVDKEELQNLMYTLDRLEKWIYEDGEDERCEKYVEKLSELKEMANPIIKRKYEHEHRQEAIDEFMKLINGVQNILTMYITGSEEYAHVEAKNMEMVQRIADERNNWLQQHINALLQLQPYQDPPITIEQIKSEKENFQKEISPLLSSPKASQHTRKQHHHGNSKH